MSSPILGIDIGSSSLKLALKSGKNIKCFEPFPLPDNLVNNNHILSSDVMASVISQAVKINHIHIKNCAVVIPSDKTFIRHTVVPYMTVSQLDLNLPFEFNDYIQKDKERYFYDYAVIDVQKNEAGEPQKLELLAAAVEKKTVEDIFKLCTKAGLHVKLAVPEIFSYRNILNSDIALHTENKTKQYCVVDFGYTSIRMNIFNGSSYETTRVIDFGGESLVNIVKDILKTDEHIALASLITNRDGIQSNDECQQFYRNVAVEIKRAIDFYTYYKSSNSIKEIYCCGGLSYSNELIDVLRKNLDVQFIPLTSIMPQTANDQQAQFNQLTVGTILQWGENIL